MSLILFFKNQLQKESLATKKMLERIPGDKFEWQPHAKSMKLGILAIHVAELPTWIGMVLNTSELDFAANSWQPAPIITTEDLLKFFEKNLEEGLSQLSNAKEKQLHELWTMRNGDEIYLTETKEDFLRTTLSQIIHHRAQLGVYLRLLDIPIPASYGPSADEPSFS
ncbi:MAG: DinB family protein [Chitinophagaceae bacterium]